MRAVILGVAAAVALLSAGGAPAHADPKLTEPYGSLFSARPPLPLPGDARPQDALQAQSDPSNPPTRRLTVSPFVVSDSDATAYGVGFGYASAHCPRHPWSVGFRYFNTEPDGGGDFDTVDLDARLVLWNPADANLPVVSIVGRYQDYDDRGERVDLLLAADQKLTQELFATVNLGWADHVDGVGSDFVGGLGLTWRTPRLPRLSLSADYVLDNNVDGEDFWTVSARWALDQTSSVRLGGGKHGTVFANYTAKWDLK